MWEAELATPPAPPGALASMPLHGAPGLPSRVLSLLLLPLLLLLLALALLPRLSMCAGMSAPFGCLHRAS